MMVFGDGSLLWKPEREHRKNCIEQSKNYNMDKPVSACGMMIISNLILNNLIQSLMKPASI